MCKTRISNLGHWVPKATLERKRKTCKVLSLGWEVRGNGGDLGPGALKHRGGKEMPHEAQRVLLFEP